MTDNGEDLDDSAEEETGVECEHSMDAQAVALSRLERFKAMTDFVQTMCFGPGARVEDGNIADIDTPHHVLVARDDALVAVFEAIERTALTW